MGTIENFNFPHAMKQAREVSEEIAKEARESLECLLSIDVTDFDGQELRRCRDEILKMQAILFLTTAEGRELCRTYIEGHGSALTNGKIKEICRQARARQHIKFAYSLN